MVKKELKIYVGSLLHCMLGGAVLNIPDFIRHRDYRTFLFFSLRFFESDSAVPANCCKENGFLLTDLQFAATPKEHCILETSYLQCQFL